VIEGPVEIRRTAPGLLTANPDGKSVAAGTALRIGPDGIQTEMPVSRYDKTLGKSISASIDMGVMDDKVFLTLYGTGIRHAGNVTVKMAEQDASVSTDVTNYPGIDLVRVLVPRSLASRGRAAVLLTADGVAANLVTVVFEQTAFLNLDFETVVRGQVASWVTGGAGCEFASDSERALPGSRSLRIQNVWAGPPAIEVAVQSLPVAVARGKRIRFSGYIKTEDITRDFAGLWWRVDGPTGILAFHNISDRGPRGTTDWQFYTIELPVAEEATNSNFGVPQVGDGTVWFDDLSVEIDGQLYPCEPDSILGEPERESRCNGSGRTPFHS
jgi:hypothetical protein